MLILQTEHNMNIVLECNFLEVAMTGEKCLAITKLGVNKSIYRFYLMKCFFECLLISKSTNDVL